MREWARVDKTSIAELEVFVRRHGASPEADYAKARIDGLKQHAPAPKSDPSVPPLPVVRPAAPPVEGERRLLARASCDPFRSRAEQTLLRPARAKVARRRQARRSPLRQNVPTNSDRDLPSCPFVLSAQFCGATGYCTSPSTAE
jgi:hypothetical protein